MKRALALYACLAALLPLAAEEAAPFATPAALALYPLPAAGHETLLPEDAAFILAVPLTSATPALLAAFIANVRATPLPFGVLAAFLGEDSDEGLKELIAAIDNENLETKRLLYLAPETADYGAEAAPLVYLGAAGLLSPLDLTQAFINVCEEAGRPPEIPVRITALYRWQKVAAPEPLRVLAESGVPALYARLGSSPAVTAALLYTIAARTRPGEEGDRNYALLTPPIGSARNLIISERDCLTAALLSFALLVLLMLTTGLRSLWHRFLTAALFLVTLTIPAAALISLPLVPYILALSLPLVPLLYIARLIVLLLRLRRRLAGNREQ